MKLDFMLFHRANLDLYRSILANCLSTRLLILQCLFLVSGVWHTLTSIMLRNAGCNTSLMSAYSSKAHSATLHSCLELCPPQSLTMSIYVPYVYEAYSALAYT